MIWGTLRNLRGVTHPDDDASRRARSKGFDPRIHVSKCEFLYGQYVDAVNAFFAEPQQSRYVAVGLDLTAL